MEKIISDAERYFQENIPYNWEKDTYLNHINEVREYTLILADEYGTDREVLEIAALLHDIGYKKTKEGKGHATISADMARNFLAKYDISPEKTNKICNAILNHSMKESAENEDMAIEDQILRDADGIAFLKSNMAYYYKLAVKELGKEEGAKETLKKIEGMSRKIQTPLGKKLAEEFFDKSRELVDNN